MRDTLTVRTHTLSLTLSQSVTHSDSKSVIGELINTTQHTNWDAPRAQPGHANAVQEVKARKRALSAAAAALTNVAKAKCQQAVSIEDDRVDDVTSNARKRRERES